MGEYTVGVEEEYQLVDPATDELQSRGRAVLETDWSGEIRRELQESTIEVGTHVCGDAAAAGRELLRLRTQAATAAAAEDLEIVALGLHPFSGWRGHALSDSERYAGMAQQYGRLAREEHIFGMHVHVAPPPSEDRIRLLNTVRRYVPHLLALSCSSPFYEGEDTGFASYRMILWRRWPGAGLPPRLADDAEYRRLVDAQLRAGLLHDERSLYWMIRRHPDYPTLEFRMCDVCPRVGDAVTIASLARCIVAGAVEGVLRPVTPAGLSAEAADALLADDTWRAARYGLAARFAEPARDGAAVSARAAIGRLLERLGPVAEALGEAEPLAGAFRIMDRGNAADRMRDAYAAGGGADDMRAIVRWGAAETLVGAGMDRRAAQRRPGGTNDRASARRGRVQQ
jgi:glutamate---cysteine ligase / carboxylate-amine ligase